MEGTGPDGPRPDAVREGDVAVDEHRGHTDRPRPYRGGSPELRLSHADRDAVAEVLREAYSKGQIDGDEFGQRVDLAMSAKYPSELEPLTADLGPLPSPGPSGASAPGPQQGEQEHGPAERVISAVGHASHYYLPFVVPLLLFAVSDKTSWYVRRQAMEALNFQLFCVIAGAASALLITPIALFWALGPVALAGAPAVLLAALIAVPVAVLLYVVTGWMILPAVAGIASLMGKNWHYPMFFRLLKDK
ncbi:DUF1707 and DUF4870 domain-containing protein [Nocardiopsis sp. HNM0947]|uniref:DUF1707 and DUF4870 domain-containing protein n=1 Tax=Nocardiopsis coralli TaxID=2772213 RepID=A0ABR9PDG6_9ACTN|nr:DUF1707 and DUF4870 domain-containing protein [Nocardiopsis coralli]